MRHILLAIAAMVSVAAPASAAVINGYIYLNNPALASNATIAGRPAVPADLTFTANGTVAFDNRIAPGTSDSATTTINQFLATGGVGPIAGGNVVMNDSYFFFDGTIVLAPGINAFSLTHDDGFEFDIIGLPGIEYSVPGPTGPTPVNFNVSNPNAVATLYNFEFAYGECCGGPAVITIFGGSLRPVPAPAALGLLGLGALAIGLRRRG